MSKNLFLGFHYVESITPLGIIGHFYPSLFIEYGQESLKVEKYDKFLSLRANLTQIEPEFGP